ncbi:MAG: hypothetical protein WBK51_02385 [Polaromonas sp.]
MSSLIALRLGWHLAFKLDRYDWSYNRLGIWVAFLLSIFFWPLLLLKPSVLIFPGRIFDGYGRAARERERDRLWQFPPKCGELIRYAQNRTMFEEGVVGEFLFDSYLVELELEKYLQNAPHQADGDFGAMLNWIRRREINSQVETDVPELWSDFQYIANNLIRLGEGKVHCKVCGKTFPTGALIPIDDSAKRGWNFDRLLCHKGHKLLVVDTGHFVV